MKSKTAVLDACVLYPAPLRDFLMHLAVLEVFRARWTDEIHDEWIRNVLLNRPDLRREQLERTRHLMDEIAPDALVKNYEKLIDDLKLPDEDDRHVLAAAIKCRADSIITFNLRDFPASELSRYEIRAIHPDDFLYKLLDANSDEIFLAAERQWKSLKNPPKPLGDFLQILEGNGLRKITSFLRKMFDDKNRLLSEI